MVETPSTMTELGRPAPSFQLPDFQGKQVSLEDFEDAPALLVMFICNHCPYVQHVQQELARLVRDDQAKGLAAVGINSNDTEKYPDDRPEKMAEQAKKQGFSFPYLFDETQDVAKAYGAACTPDFFLFDSERRLVYRGQMDDSRPGNQKPVTGKDLRQAIEAVLAGRPLPEQQKPSQGCNIKWKPGNEPAYFGGR